MEKGIRSKKRGKDISESFKEKKTVYRKKKKSKRKDAGLYRHVPLSRKIFASDISLKKKKMNNFSS